MTIETCFHYLKYLFEYFYLINKCLASVSTALGTGFKPYAPTVWSRCMRLIGATLQQIEYNQTHPDTEEAEKDFLVVALDLVSGILQGLGSECEGLINSSTPNLMQILEVCAQDPMFEVKQSVFALYGDLAMQTFSAMQPYVHTMYPILIAHIDPLFPPHAASVCSKF